MTKIKFVNTSIVTLTFVILAIISINLNSNNHVFEDRGSLFLKDFTKILIKLIIFP